MEDQREVVVLSAVRTPIGKYGGGLASVPPCDLAAAVVREAVSRAGVQPDDVGHAVFGNVIHTEVRDMYLSRVAAVNGGLLVETPALTVNAVTPGFIDTGMLATVPDKVLDRLRTQIPVGRLGAPEEIARVVCFLAADASSYITGQIWAVNGGLDM